MTKDNEVVRDTGNVFRDFGRPNADLEQLRSMLAAGSSAFWTSRHSR
jgi:hypothetical protein